MVSKRIDLVGRSFGALYVEGRASGRDERTRYQVLCRLCGIRYEMRADRLLSGTALSCGCARFDLNQAALRLPALERHVRAQERGRKGGYARARVIQEAKQQVEAARLSLSEWKEFRTRLYQSRRRGWLYKLEIINGVIKERESGLPDKFFFDGK